MIAGNRHSVETALFRCRSRIGTLINFSVVLVYRKTPVNVPDQTTKT